MDLLKEHFKAETNIIDLIALSRDIGLKNDPVVVMRDKLVGVPGNTKNVIINMAKTGSPGTHWVCFYNDKGNVSYFDSFGIIPIIEVERWARKNKKNIYYNTEQLQDIRSGFCGENAILWLYCMENNIDINHFLKVIRTF